MNELLMEIRRYEVGFVQFIGSVDLLAMSNRLPVEQFRRYIQLSREYRAALRAK